jgi:hypothetical protein
MIAAMREATDQAFDIHIFWMTSLPRTLEAPDILRIASPVYFENVRFGVHQRSDVALEDRVLQSMRARLFRQSKDTTLKRNSPSLARRSPLFSLHHVDRARGPVMGS